MISIGSIFGGGELAGGKTDRLIRRFCSALPRVQNPDAADINIIFHVPGSIVKPDYQGVRTGRYSAKMRTLMVQVSIPESLMESPELEPFLDKSILEAVAAAKDFFGKRKMNFNEGEYLKVIEEMRERLKEI